MHTILPFFLAMIAAIVLLNMWAVKLRIAYPILLVIFGLLVSFVPGLPAVKVDPDLIFFIFLPPLLFEASWAISFKEMKRWWRIIGSFAFLVVFFTALSVAVAANYFIPGFTIALGFLLGGIVSPPDAVSTGAIMKFVKIPNTTSAILEGESLLNDASSLIIFRFCINSSRNRTVRMAGSFFKFFMDGYWRCRNRASARLDLCSGTQTSAYRRFFGYCNDTYRALHFILGCRTASQFRGACCCLWRFVYVNQTVNIFKQCQQDQRIQRMGKCCIYPQRNRFSAYWIRTSRDRWRIAF